MNFSAEAEQLLLEWGNALLQLQLTQPQFPTLDGGILCPACACVHGRSAEMVYPFLRLANMTGQDQFLNAAARLQNWRRFALPPDGGIPSNLILPAPEKSRTEIMFNSLTGAIALAHALRFHGNFLDPATQRIWRKDLQKNALWLFDKVSPEQLNSNYLASAGYAMAVLGHALDEPRFTRKGQQLAQACLKRMTPVHHFLPNQELKTPGKGFLPVDLAETVSVALPALALYYRLTHDAELLTALLDSLETHLQFLLPDGGWDNSWGSGQEQWTYWGHAESGSSLVATILMAAENAAFTRFAGAQFTLLKNSTRNGFLFPGLHANPENPPPCILSLCSQANALATILDHGFSTAGEPTPDFPAPALLEFPEIRTWKVHHHPWHATLTATNSDKNHTTGGALALLWHARAGLLISTSPVPPDWEQSQIKTWLTPRLEFALEGTVYRQIHDLNAQITKTATSQEIEFIVYTKLLSAAQQDPPFGAASSKIHYCFSANQFTILMNVGRTIPLQTMRFWLPVISSGEKITHVAPKIVELEKSSGRLQITGNVPLLFPANSIFNPVPGLAAIPLAIDWPIKQIETLEVTFSFLGPTEIQEQV